MLKTTATKFATVSAVFAVVCFFAGDLNAQQPCDDCQTPGSGAWFDNGFETPGGSSGFASEACAGCSSGCSSCASLPACGDPCCEDLGAYVSVFGGISTIHSFENELDITADPNTPMSEFRNFSGDSGESFGFAIGKVLHQRARGEFEFTKGDMDITEFRVQQFTGDLLTASTNTPATGNVETFSVMGNFLFDLSPRCVGRANLYGGGGLGALDVNGTATAGGNDYLLDDTAFAYQLIAGVNYAARRNIDLFTEYRFLGSTVDVRDVTAGNSLGSFDFETNSLFMGVRFRR